MEDQTEGYDEALNIIMQWAEEEQLLGSFADEILEQGQFPLVTEDVFENIQPNELLKNVPSTQNSEPSTSSSCSQSSPPSTSTSCSQRSEPSTSSSFSQTLEPSTSSSSCLTSEPSNSSSCSQSSQPLTSTSCSQTPSTLSPCSQTSESSTSSATSSSCSFLEESNSNESTNDGPSSVGGKGEPPFEVKSKANLMNEKIHHFTENVDRQSVNEPFNATFSVGQMKRKIIDQTTWTTFKRQARIDRSTDQGDTEAGGDQSSQNAEEIYENSSIGNNDGDTENSGEQNFNILDSFNELPSSSRPDVNGLPSLQGEQSNQNVSQNNAESNDEIEFLEVIRGEVEYLGEYTLPTLFIQLQNEILKSRFQMTWPQVILNSGKLPGDAILDGNIFHTLMICDILIWSFCATDSIFRKCRAIKRVATFYFHNCAPWPTVSSCIAYFFTGLLPGHYSDEPRHPSGRTFLEQLLHELGYPENSTVPPFLRYRFFAY